MPLYYLNLIKMVIYSHSRLATFEQCPIKFKFKYIDRIKPEIEQTIEGFLGNKVHEVLEVIYNETAKGKNFQLDEVIQIYLEKWNKDFNSNIKIIKKENNTEYYLNQGLNFLINYFVKYSPFKDNTIAIEKRITVNLEGEYKLQGYIDRLVHNKETNIFEIHDYKTGSFLKTQEELDKDRQLALYSLGIKEMFNPVNEVHLIWHFLAFNKKMVSTRTQSQLNQLKQETIELIKKIESTKQFQKNKGILCNWCEFQNHCNSHPDNSCDNSLDNSYDNPPNNSCDTLCNETISKKSDWSLYEDEKGLQPLVFSNGKSQSDIVNEVIHAIEQGYKIIFIKGVCGSGKCLEKDTLIFCKPDNEKYFSYYKISDLIGKEGIILSVNEEGNIIKSRFKNIRETEKKEVYKLKTSTGREIFTSKNHPFLTITKKGVEWVPLENLNNNSYICLPSKINLHHNLDYDENKLKILAHLIAEGKLKDVGSPVYTQDPVENPEIRQDYIGSLKKVFPEGEIKQDKKDVKMNFRIMDTRFGTTNKLRLFIREHGLDGKKSAEKFVPKIVFNLSDKKISIFLKVLFSCDGSIYQKTNKNRKSKQTIIEYDSISDRLIKDVSILLSILGVEHTITRKNFRDIKDYSKRITISNQEGIRKFIEKIGFIGRKQKLALELYKTTKIHKFTNIDKVPRIIREYLKDKGYSYLQLDRFLNYEGIETLRKEFNYKKIRFNKLIKSPCVFKQGKIDFLRDHLRKINFYIKDKTLSFICNKDIVWHTVKSIEYIKNDKTYDLEVEDYHNFIADGIIVHNSAVALNLAKELGKTSIVVPIKSLQEQYIKDYTGKKYVLKNEKKLKISSIVGRKNFKCKFLEESNQGIDLKTYYTEKNAKLSDVFIGMNQPKISQKDDSCDNIFLPCKIEIKEKNMPRIKEYINKNPEIRLSNFSSINEVKRMSLAPICPYWAPIMPEEFEIKKFKDAKKIKYPGLNNKMFTIYQRKKGCPYYDQYESYTNSDVIIFNSMKYKLETLMDRKPVTELEIIDECDEFLDSFASQEQISLNRLSFALSSLFAEKQESQAILDKLIDITNTLKSKFKDLKQKSTEKQEEIFAIKDTLVETLLLAIMENKDLMDEIEADDYNYIYHLDEVARIFHDFFNETFFSIEKKETDIILNLVTTNLAKKFNDLVEKNKILVMMSGTIHSESVLKNIFGLENFKIIEAEIKHQGELIKCKNGYEKNCSYANFGSNKITREEYLFALSKSVSCAKEPILIHVNSFSDLPTEQEKIKYNLNNLPTKYELIQKQKNDPFGQRIKDFKQGKTKILFTTKCNRGIDFPGETCNSIIITKFPYPNISNIFWKILKKTNPQHFMNFYLDKARRELLQKIYRGLRSKDDKVYLLSPDLRVLDF
jgi:intein/homing endonuclease/RecB family exonuclease